MSESEEKRVVRMRESGEDERVWCLFESGSEREGRMCGVQ